MPPASTATMAITVVNQNQMVRIDWVGSLILVRLNMSSTRRITRNCSHRKCRGLVGTAKTDPVTFRVEAIYRGPGLRMATPGCSRHHSAARMLRRRLPRVQIRSTGFDPWRSLHELRSPAPFRVADGLPVAN